MPKSTTINIRTRGSKPLPFSVGKWMDIGEAGGGSLTGPKVEAESFHPSHLGVTKPENKMS